MAVAISGAVIAPSAAQADAPSGLPGGVESAAHGHGIWVDGLGIPVVETTNARSAFNGAPWSTSQRATLDPALLDAITLNLGSVMLPLMKNATHTNGVLDLGSYGDTEALIGTADSDSTTSSVGSAGVAGQGGNTVILNPSQVPSGFRPAKLDLAALLKQLAGNASAGVLDTGTFEIGAVGARAGKVNGVLKREYMVAAANLKLHSPLVAGVSGQLRGALNGVGTTLNAAVGSDGVLGKAVSGLPNLNVPGLLTANLSGGTIAIDGLDDALDAVHAELIGTPLKDPNNIVNIDLSNGAIAVDLSKVVDGGDLNSLDPNTALLSAPVLNRITLAVEKALGTLTTKAVAAVKAAINNLDVTINVKAKLKLPLSLVTADVNIQVKAKLGQLTNDLPGTPTVTVTQLAGGGLLGPVLALLGLDLAGLTNALTQPLLSTLLTALKPVVGTLLTTVGSDLAGTLNGITAPVITALNPVLLDFGKILGVTINEQPDLKGTPTAGDLGAASRTVRALAVRLLPDLGAANIELASATTLAADPVASGPQLSGTSAPQGGTVHLTGTGFAAGESVTLERPTGAPVSLTADPDGKISNDWTVPETQAAPGTVTFTATGATSGAATATVNITLPAAKLTAPATAKQGETITITGSDFASTEPVTVTMPDGTSTHPTAVGGAITTSWTIPEDQQPGPVTFSAKGDDSKRTAKTGTGASSGETEISTADALLNATDAKQGGLVHLTGSGFIAGEDVVIDLPGAPGTKTVQASGSGAIVYDWRVPASQPANNSTPYSAKGKTSGRTADAVAKIGTGPWITIVPSPAQPGDTVTVTGDGFDPGENVTVDGPGADCARTVAADATGHFQYTCTIPANQNPGTVVVTGTGDNGNTSETEIDVILVTLSATSPVKPGDTVALTGAGFANGETVTIAVPGGTVSATASGTGAISASWVVPANRASGEVSFTATGTSGRHAVAKTTVQRTPKITVTPSPAHPGDTITVSGTGFEPNENVTVTGPGADCTRGVQANGNGAFTFTCKIPANQPTGTVPVTATGDSGGTATVNLPITAAAGGPSITAKPSPAQPGELVTITGTRFTPGESVSLTWPGDCMPGKTLVASGSGTFSAYCRVPANAANGSEVTAVATGKVSKKPASAKVTVKAVPVATTPWKRLGGKNRYETAVKVSREQYPKGASTVVIARSDLAPDALAAAPFATKKRAPLLLTAPKSLNSATKAELKRLKPRTVYVMGSKSAISTKVAKKIKAMKIRVVRLGGKNRYETAVKIVRAGWGTKHVESMFIATGLDFPDALSGGAAAAGINAPVLLVKGTDKSMSREVKAQVKAMKPSNVFIAGNTKMVSTRIEKQLKSYSSNLQRFAGKDRYGTSAQIAKKWYKPHGLVYLAVGDKFPDALAGAAVAGLSKAPVMLSTKSCVPKEPSAVLKLIQPRTGYVLGSTSALSDSVLKSQKVCSNR